MTPEQKSKLQEIANGVKGSFTSLSLTDILNRIHLITDRPYDGCIKGLKMMLQEQMIEATFIPDLHKLEAKAKVINQSMPIIEALGLELTPDASVPKDNPLLTRSANLSHINSNF